MNRRRNLSLAALALGIGLLPFAAGMLRTSWMKFYLLGLLPIVLYFAVGSQRSRRRPQVLLALVSISLSLCVFDLVARLAARDILYYRPHERFVRRWAPMPRLRRYEAGVAVTMETHGDLAALSGMDKARESRTVNFETDALGFRNRSDSTDEAIEVLFLGDSVAAGNGSSQESNVAVKLSELSGLRVYNLSVGAAAPWHELLTLKAAYRELELVPGAVLVWQLYAGNDLDERCQDELEPPATSSALRRLAIAYSSFRRRSPVRILLDRLFPGAESAEQVQQVLFRSLGSSRRTILYFALQEASSARSVEEVRAHPHYECVRRVFRSLDEFAESRGLALIVVVAPTKGEIYPPDSPLEFGNPTPSGFSAQIQVLGREQGVRVVDLKPSLLRAARRLYKEEEAILWWYDDTHWNHHGHAAVALILEDLVRDQAARQD